MGKFKIGDQVRKDLRSGIWVVTEYEETTDSYTIQQEEKHMKVEYPKTGTMIYHVESGEMETVKNVTEYTYIFVDTVTSDEIQPVPNQKLLDYQNFLGISDKQLAVLRKIDSLNLKNEYPFSISNANFDIDEFNALQNLIEIQYGFFIGERSIFGEDYFLEQDDHGIILMKALDPILKIYEDYQIT